MGKKNKVSKRELASGFVSGFKNFIMRGNVIDMAVGVIVGGAFGKIITSLVNDIILPPIGVLLGGVEFRDLQWLISRKPILDDGGSPVFVNGIQQFTDVYIRYGNLIQIILEFLIIAVCIYFVLYFFIKRKENEAKILALKEKQEQESKEKQPVVKEVPEDIKLLTEIRDLLKRESNEKI